MKKTKYMHTIDGRPANFDGSQVILVGLAQGEAVDLRESLREIRREQQASKRFREGLGWRDEVDEYGYVRVRVP